jgi:protein-tyrosine-phosphatase
MVSSAGFYPKADRASPDRHVEMCRAFNVDLSSHRSSVVTPDDIESADAVLLMDRSNWISLATIGVPEKKLIWLGAWSSGGGAEIPDPYRMDDVAARRLLGRMAQCADRLANELTSARKSDRD